MFVVPESVKYKTKSSRFDLTLIKITVYLYSVSIFSGQTIEWEILNGFGDRIICLLCGGLITESSLSCRNSPSSSFNVSLDVMDHEGLARFGNNIEGPDR